MHSLSGFVRLPSLLEGGSEKSHKTYCQNCNIKLDTPEQYFQHVHNKNHKMRMKRLPSHGNGHSSSDTEGRKDCDHVAAVAESAQSLTLEKGIFQQLDKRSVPGASMMMFWHSSEAASKAVCVCCACQDAFPASLLIKHLDSHGHLLQTLLHLNPWRLPFGWRQVPERKSLQSELEAEEKKRGWCQVVLKVMDFPCSVFQDLNPPNYQKVLLCQNFSRHHKHGTYPLLGRNFIVSHEAHDAACNSTYDSLLCLLCGRRLTEQEGHAHAFSWEHVTMFLDRFHPGSLMANCGTKILLDLASQAARIHRISDIQKIKLDRPIREPCNYARVKLILSAALRRTSKGPLIPLFLSHARLVPKGTSLTSEYSVTRKMTPPPSKIPSRNPTDGNGTSGPQKTVNQTGLRISGHVLTSAKEEGERKRSMDAHDDKVGCKRQRRGSREITREEKPKLKYENSDQKQTETTYETNPDKAAVPMAACTDTTSQITAFKSTTSTTTYTSKVKTATTTTSSANGTVHTYSCAPKLVAPTSTFTKSCGVTATSLNPPPTTAKSIAPSASSCQSCRDTATYSTATSAVYSGAIATTGKSTAAAVTSFIPTSSGVAAKSTRLSSIQALPISTVTAPSNPTAAVKCATAAKHPGVTAIHAATTTKPTASNTVQGASTSTFSASVTTSRPCASGARCAVSTSKLIASDSSLKSSFSMSGLGHKEPEVGSGRETVRHSHLAAVKKNAAFKSSVRSQAPGATPAVRSRKSLVSSKKMKNNNTGGSLADPEPQFCKCCPCPAVHATSSANRPHSKSKATVPKVGLGFIVAVNSDGRKQSYCTLCHVRLGRSSHPTENIHMHNYMKRRFPELNDENLASINQEKFAFNMAEVEKCLGLRKIQTIAVTNDKYNELSSLPEAQALQRLEAQFQVSSNALVPVEQQIYFASSQGASSPEDDDALVGTAAEPEATVQSIHGFRCGEEICENHDFDDPDLKLAEKYPEDFEPSTSVLFSAESQTDLCLKDTERNLQGSEPASSLLVEPEPMIGDPGFMDIEENLSDLTEPSASVLLGPDPKIGDADAKETEKNLSDCGKPTPPTPLVLDPPIGDCDLKAVKKTPEGSDGPSPPELSGAEHPHIGNPGMCEDLEGSNGSGPLNSIAKRKDGNVAQALLLSGNESNLTMFLWVRGLFDQPILGLASVYECRGVSENSFYLCESCSQKFTVGDICRHVVSVKHQLTYMLKAYPHLMNSFWYEDDLREEMKLTIFNHMAVEVAARERSKKMDAKVLVLFQGLYESVWKAPVREALNMLRSATCQSVVTSQQTATQTSEKRSGQNMDLCVDSNADSVSCSSSDSVFLTLQGTRRNSHSPPELTVSSPVSLVPPVNQVKEEVMQSKCRPPEKLGSLTKPPPVFQVKNEPMLTESKPPVRLCPIGKKQPGLQVKAELKQSSGPVSEQQPSFQVKAELTAPESGFLETSGLIFEEQRRKQPKAERMRQVSRSPESAGLVSVGQSCIKVKSEVIPKDDGSPKTTGVVSGAWPGYQINTEPLVKERSFPLPTASLLTMPQLCQVKDKMSLSSCGSSSTPIPRSKPAPSSKVKDDPELSECKPLLATPLATKLHSSFLVKGGACSEDVAAPETMGPTIPQYKFLHTRKREALESLGELIRICTSKTNL
ncbi:uncharacterized protein LOC127604087 [Hippocampus zosterae]|uniref:uncharacterized protein LOC127604087 n=1 Tax=Hippocampus zosterae TaxID=109293 RepID=UPI00223CB89A|nr:uncharacterized protein LOC127604087 [Hippocampus zosterae]